MILIVVRLNSNQNLRSYSFQLKYIYKPIDTKLIKLVIVKNRFNSTLLYQKNIFV